jgi:hypothetical protein
MKLRAVSARWLGWLAFLAWEGCWAYEYIAAHSENDDMRRLLAVLMGVLAPALLALLVGAAGFFGRLRHEAAEEPE